MSCTFKTAAPVALHRIPPLEDCHCKQPCTKCGDLDHHEILCTAKPKFSLFSPPPPQAYPNPFNFRPWGQGLSNRVGCSATVEKTKPVFFGGPTPTPLFQPRSSARAGHSRQAPALSREAWYKRRAPKNMRRSAPESGGTPAARPWDRLKRFLPPPPSRSPMIPPLTYLCTHGVVELFVLIKCAFQCVL